MGYVSRRDHAVLDFRVSLPQEWARDQQRRQACHVPEDVHSRTRHDQCVERLDLWGAQVPPGWVVGDDALGRHTPFRHELRERGEHYILGVPCTTMRDLASPWPTYQGRGRRPKLPWQSVTAWRTSRTMDAWTRWTVRDGEKGAVEIEMVKRRVQTRLERKRPGPQEWLVVTRRPLADANRWEAQASRDATDHDTRYRSYYSLTPTQTPASGLEEPSLAELARVIKAGVCIEASFKRGKGEAGMDAYQVRTWEGWHHHTEDTRTADEQALWARLQQHPELVQMQALMQQGRAIIRQRHADALDAWLLACRTSSIVELQNFVDVLQRDYAAVKAALTLPWSTGPVEGHINRLKLIKRSGYGRMQLDLLRQRVLYDAA